MCMLTKHLSPQYIHSECTSIASVKYLYQASLG